VTTDSKATVEFRAPDEPNEPVQLWLLVVGDGVYATEPLPATGRVTIGRASDGDVYIEHPSISREHAVLHLNPLRIEDACSANGTFVREMRIPQKVPIPIRINEAVRIGAVTIIPQRESPKINTRRIRSHAPYFEDRLEDECSRATRTHAGFVVVSAILDRDIAELQDHVAGCLRPGDVVAAYASNELELLLLDTTTEEADAALARIHELVGGRTLGIAEYPRDGRDAPNLLGRARDRAHGQAAAAFGEIVIRDERMTAVYALAERVAGADITVLLLGETGVGKEMLAETIHRRSTRAGKPFLRLNCAALTETLLESELFGHERGAFTGAIATKQGLFEAADGGVVFLDEVGELALSTQAKLLRVLDERKVMRVGDVTPRPIDVRIVAATNRDLEREVSAGNFRLDLMYRLNAMSIVIPPLRERVLDIEPLARAFLQRIAAKMNRPAPALSPAALGLLQRYAWPGNVRELRNVIERAVVLCGGSEITARDLPEDKLLSTFSTSRRSSPTEAPIGDDERARIIAALDACAGNQTEAAKLLGISRRTLITRIEKLAVPRPRKK
jgi:DNA-binding NtrC family response regulator